MSKSTTTKAKTPSGLYKGDCLEQLQKLPDNSVDSIVTDPPYELGFMGRSWDSSGIAYNVELWKECLRVLKPGGHALAFGGSRTYHRMAVAVEDAGFEIRESMMWLYGQGMPKSHNVAIALDKKAGVMGHRGKRVSIAGNIRAGQNVERAKAMPAHEPITAGAKEWAGWGTGLKPAHEPIVVARKPLDGTVANNVLVWGTGALNIDGCRIPSDERSDGLKGRPIQKSATRWPANVIHDGSAEILACFPEKKPRGSTARFFYCAKPTTRERNAGLEGLPVSRPDTRSVEAMGTFAEKGIQPQQNIHETVKPVALMKYLCRLVTPPGGVILDPFLGSGTTAVAAILEGFDWIGCELTEEYWPIIEGRVAHAKAEFAKSAVKAA
ncbi:MAG TPA: site-specific DNA-methyltransferase [Acidimicrobiales bacterium]